MNTIRFEKGPAGKAITITTSYAAPRQAVWAAYTDPAILDKWWGPLPWKAVTAKMKLREGGRWLYYMVSPEGQKVWSLADFGKIVPGRSFEALDAFCDEHGKVDPSAPRLQWKVTFEGEGDRTTVTSHIAAQKPEDLNRILEMGFEEGYKTGIRQLHELFEKGLPG